jgi:peptidoglycan/xylan/chitin deacetylase (PgdA/CDA1 family)
LSWVGQSQKPAGVLLKNASGKFVAVSQLLACVVLLLASFGFVLLLPNPLTRPPAWLQPLFPGTEWRGAPAGPGGRPRLYLTFDDGPIPEETPWVLEQLAAFGAQATFFCVGDNLLRYPDIARATLAAGHRLGNHTQHHRSAWNTPRADYLAGVAACQQVLREEVRWVGGEKVSNVVPAATLASPLPHLLTSSPQPLFRPPYGRLTWPVLRALRPHYRLIMWSLLTRDYDPGLAPERALRLTLAAARPGDIVVLHDSRKASRSLRFVLPRLLAHYAELGYEFAVV